MYKINLIFNIIIIIGLFIVDGITNNIVGFFSIPLLLLLPKIRGILFNKNINSNIAYEVLELIFNFYLVIIIVRTLFDSSINFDDFKVFSYSYIVIRIFIATIVLFLMNLLLNKSKNNKERIVLDELHFGYIVLFTSILGIYFALTRQSNFDMILTIVLCFLNIYFCFKLINDLKCHLSGLFFALIISISGILVGNEILILAFIRIFGLTYYHDKKLFYK